MHRIIPNSSLLSVTTLLEGYLSILSEDSRAVPSHHSSHSIRLASPLDLEILQWHLTLWYNCPCVSILRDVGCRVRTPCGATEGQTASPLSLSGMSGHPALDLLILM